MRDAQRIRLAVDLSSKYRHTTGNPTAADLGRYTVSLVTLCSIEV